MTTTVSSRPFTSTARCRLTPSVLLPPSQPRLDRGTVSAAGTVCESMIAAVGHRSRPARPAPDSRSRSASRMRDHAPPRGPAGEDRVHRPGWRELHRQLPHTTTMYRMASTIARRQCFSGRPPRPAVLPGAGDSGSRIAHCASVTYDQYTAQPCPPAAWGGHDGDGEIGDDGIVGSWSGRGLGKHRPNQGTNFFGSPRGTRPPIAVLKHSVGDGQNIGSACRCW